MSAAPAANLTGKWTASANAGGQVIEIAMDLKQDGSNFTGSSAAMIGNGTIDGGKLSGKTFTATLRSDVQGQAVAFKMEGTIDGDKMTGTFTAAGFGQVPFTATRVK